MVLTKQEKFIAIDTPLGADVLLLTGFKGREAISGLFRFELDLWSENHGIAFNDIIGANATLSVMLADGEERFFNGIISRFSQKTGETEVGVGRLFGHYRATLVPWLWLLTRTTDSRIFQGLSVPDIVEKIFVEIGFSHYTLHLAESYKPRDYCVQYRETDFNFISRILEEEGIFYFFEHEEGQHTLVLADTPDQHQPHPKQESVPFAAKLGGWLREDVITDLERMQRIEADKYTFNTFNFQIPSADLKVEARSQRRRIHFEDGLNRFAQMISRVQQNLSPGHPVPISRACPHVRDLPWIVWTLYPFPVPDGFDLQNKPTAVE